MLENLLTGWKGKILVLVLLGFAATDFVITMTLSAADAAKHAIENPFLHAALGEHQILVTLAILVVLAAVFLEGFAEAIGMAAAAAITVSRSERRRPGAWRLGGDRAPGCSRHWRSALAAKGDSSVCSWLARSRVSKARAWSERVRDGRLGHAADRRRRGGSGVQAAIGRRARRARVANTRKLLADRGRDHERHAHRCRVS